MTSPLRRAVPWLCLWLCAGCDDPFAFSAHLPASGLNVSGTLRSNGALAQLHLDRVWTTLDERTPAVIPSGGDRWILTPQSDRGAAQTLSIVGVEGFAQIETPDTQLSLALRRGRRRDDVVLDLSLPEPFSIEAPAQTVPRSAPISVRWPPDPEPTDGVQVVVDGPCLDTPLLRPQDTDSGELLIQPPDLFVTEGTDACDLTVTVTRTARSDDPAGLATAWFTLSQVRTVLLHTVP